MIEIESDLLQIVHMGGAPRAQNSGNAAFFALLRRFSPFVPGIEPTIDALL
jgi:hypothetical protein